MDGPVEGFAAPVHRALTEPILLGGAPRAVAIFNGTVAAALGLGRKLSRGKRYGLVLGTVPAAVERGLDDDGAANHPGVLLPRPEGPAHRHHFHWS